MAGDPVANANLICIPGSAVDCSEMLGLIVLILNIVSGGIGTILSAFVDKKGVNLTALLVGIIQLVLVWCLIGWIWGIIHGYGIYRMSVGKS